MTALLGRAGAICRHPCFVAFGATGLALIVIVISLYAVAAGNEQATPELMSPAMIDLAEAAQLLESYGRGKGDGL